MIKLLRHCIYLLAVLLLVSCTTISPTPTDNLVIKDSEKHRQQLLALERWKIEGKLGFKDKQQGGSALLQWQQNRNSFDMTLSGPMGFKTTHITGNSQLAELRQGGMTHYSANSATELTSHLFGWAWPVDELLFWIKGLAAPEVLVTSASHDEQGLLKELHQSDWQLTFSNYQRARQLVLPGKIIGVNGELSFTLVIKDWQPLR